MQNSIGPDSGLKGTLVYAQFIQQSQRITSELAVVPFSQTRVWLQGQEIGTSYHRRPKFRSIQAFRMLVHFVLVCYQFFDRATND